MEAPAADEEFNVVEAGEGGEGEPEENVDEDGAGGGGGGEAADDGAELNDIYVHCTMYI